MTSTPQATESSPSSTTTTTTSQVQKSSEPPRSEGQKDAPSQEKKREGPAPSLTQTSTGPTPQPIQQQQQQQNAPKATLQQEDENIRRLLRYYRIDDGDLIEVAAGSPPRLVLVHPERPLPPYILQNKELVQKLQSGQLSTRSCRSNPTQRSTSAHQTSDDDGVTGHETEGIVTGTGCSWRSPNGSIRTLSARATANQRTANRRASGVSIVE